MSFATIPDSIAPTRTNALSDAPAIASLSGLTVRYGTRTIIPDMTLDIPEGCVGLLGPNGAGKSTLIKTLLGFLKPTAGIVTVLGKNIALEPLQIRQRMGLMPEQDCHIPGMNAVTFVAYAGELAGMPAAQALRRAHEVLEYCSLGEARYRNVETYSTGMKQRIKLAQALVHGPKILLLDEPTNGLDPQGRDEMLDLIRDISHGKGLSVLVSSHLLPDIERTCDAVIVVKAGQVITQGPIATLRGTGEAEFEVDLRIFSEPFVALLQQQNIKLTHRQGSHCRFIFPPGTELQVSTILFTAARMSGAQVRGFRPAQRSLEEIFMEAITA